MYFSKQQSTAYSQVVASAWTDEAYLARLLANPKEVLSEVGIYVPSAFTVTVRQNSDAGKVDFCIPPKPTGISDEDLKKLLAPISYKGTF